MDFEALKQHIAANYPEMTLLETGKCEPMYEIKPGDLVATCQKLRDDDKFKFDFFCNLGGVDTTERFEAVYQIASTITKARVDFKVILPYDNAVIDSVQTVWPAANWYEREMWELYGIDIKNHGNLKRFLLPDDWDQGYPMRKDWDADDFIRMPEL